MKFMAIVVFLGALACIYIYIDDLLNGESHHIEQDKCPHGWDWDDCPDCRH
jgi:hypothetical protein